MDKAKFGKYFYYATLIISIALLVLAVFLLNVNDIEDEELKLTTYVYRYMIIDGVLFVIIPTGCFVHEITRGEYNKKMVTIKMLLAYIGGIASILLIYYTRNLTIAKVSTLIGALILVFSASPTVKEKKQ